MLKMIEKISYKIYGRMAERRVETSKIKEKKTKKLKNSSGAVILWLYTSIFLFVSLKMLNMERTFAPAPRAGNGRCGAFCGPLRSFKGLIWSWKCTRDYFCIQIT